MLMNENLLKELVNLFNIFQKTIQLKIKMIKLIKELF